MLAQGLASEGAGVKELVLAENSIGDAGASAVGQTLGLLCGLVKLDLSSNHIGDFGAKGLAEGLQAEGSTLQSLQLNANQLGGAAGVSLGRAAAKADELCIIQLRHNSLTGSAAGAALIGALECNAQLTTVDVQHNALSFKVGGAQ